MDEPRQLTLFESPYCQSCPANTDCDAGKTDLGCVPAFLLSASTPTIMLHPSSSDFLPRLAEVNGTHLDISARPQSLPTIPPYIPRIRTQTRINDFRDISAIAVSLSQVQTLATTMTNTGATARELLGLTEHQQVIVTGFEKDRFLEKVWLRPNRHRLMHAIKTLRPDIAISWSYSVWHFDKFGNSFPRIEHLYNQKRGLIIFSELQKLGIPTIPHIYWGVRDDLRRWATWLDQNPCVSAIAIDLQTVDSEEDWQDVLEDVRYFRTILPRTVSCIFGGICRVDRVQSIRTIWPNLSLCNFGAYFSALLPKKPLFGLRPRVGSFDEWPPSRVFRDTVSQYSALVNPDGVSSPHGAGGISGRTPRSHIARVATSPASRGARRPSSPLRRGAGVLEGREGRR